MTPMSRIEGLNASSMQNSEVRVPRRKNPFVAGALFSAGIVALSLVSNATSDITVETYSDNSGNWLGSNIKESWIQDGCKATRYGSINMTGTLPEVTISDVQEDCGN